MALFFFGLVAGLVNGLIGVVGKIVFEEPEMMNYGLLLGPVIGLIGGMVIDLIYEDALLLVGALNFFGLAMGLVVGLNLDVYFGLTFGVGFFIQGVSGWVACRLPRAK